MSEQNETHETSDEQDIKRWTAKRCAADREPARTDLGR
jgi:hypothetical protein